MEHANGFRCQKDKPHMSQEQIKHLHLAHALTFGIDASWTCATVPFLRAECYTVKTCNQKREFAMWQQKWTKQVKIVSRQRDKFLRQ